MVNQAGRARDASIDRRVLAAAARHLSAYGYEGMSLSAVAEEAGTTRQALYRRWPAKSDLATAVIAEMSDTAVLPDSSDPFSDLVAELLDFQQGVSGKGRLSLVGTMLQDTTDISIRERYRAQVIAPRRRRLRATLERAIERGLIDADADLEVALTMCTGAWYGRALAGAPIPHDWALRTAALVWRALGGQVHQVQVQEQGKAEPGKGQSAK
ncbi:TetR/AcrR family transcriptional regulator [Leifsonia sp. Le1]|uniref:TetR/AcrR family transcriptional regulator n=1 Tax=Leifsonia sp. Le1 TaxID=3404918 RepID=UPI003EBF9500